MASGPAKGAVANDWQAVPASDWQDVNAPTAPTDTRNGIQKAFDTATTVTPEQEKGHSWPVNALQKVGAGVMQVATPFVHPEQALEKAQDTLMHPHDTMASTIQGIKDNPWQTAGNVLGGAALGGAVEEAPGGIRPFSAKGPGTIGRVMNAIPTRAKAGAIFEDLNQKLANQPVNLTQSTPPLNQLEKIGNAGPGVPTTVGKLLDRSRTMFPMNYPEARLFQENLSNPSIVEKQGIGGSMKGGIKQLNKAYFNDIQDAANTQGLGEDYQNAMTMNRRANQLNHAFKTAGKFGAGALGLGAADRFIRESMR